MSSSMNPQSRQSGFRLFPTAQTPPVKIDKTRYRSRSASRRQLSIGTLPSLSENSAYNGDGRVEEWIGEPVPPVPTLQRIEPAVSRSQKVFHSRNSSRSSVPSVQHGSPQNLKEKKWKEMTISAEKPRTMRTLFPWSSTKKVEQNESHDRVGTESRSKQRVQKKSFGQLSQMFDAEIGKVDQKKLSTYLGNILDTSFEMPDLVDVQAPRSDSEQEYQSNPRPAKWRDLRSYHGPSVRLSTIGDGDCTCDPTLVICQCSSSTEFRTFQESSNDHKQQASISSTACLLGIPCARFNPVVRDTGTPGPVRGPLLSSPPGLSYSSSGSKTADDSDWSVPGSPTAWGDPSTPPPNMLRGTRSYLMHSNKTPSTEEAVMNRRISDGQSFSRPFIAGKLPTVVCSGYQASQSPSWSWTSSPPATGKKSSNHNYLGSRETISTFDFDFDSQKSPQRSQELDARQTICHTPEQPTDQNHTQELSRRQTATKFCESATSRVRRWSSCSVQSHSHKRSNSSNCSSLFEVIESANTATFALAGSAKPVVVMHRQTQNFTNEVSSAKSAHWKRIEREQQEQLQKLQKARQQQYQFRNSVQVRTSFRRSVYKSGSATPSGEASRQSINPQQRNLKKPELGPSIEDDEDCLAKTKWTISSDRQGKVNSAGRIM